MRTVSDGHGDEPWEDPATATSADDENTRVFTRDSFGSVPPGTDNGTREFDRDAVNETTRESARDGGGDASATRTFTRPGADGTSDEPAVSPEPVAPPEEGAAFTRRFVRERPVSRDGGRRSARPEARDAPPTDAFPPPTEDDEPPEGPPPPGGPGDFGGDRPDNPGRGRPARPPRRRRRRFRLRWLVTLVLLTALAIPPGTWGWVWYTARQDDRSASDAIVVLGASQYNGVPSPIFEARLRHAQVLFLDGVAPFVVTVGGKLDGDNFTEAASGRNWLIEVGVPADRIIAVEEGSDTLQSIDAVSTVFDEQGWETATLVSDPWHSLRSKWMAGDHGIEAGTSPSRTGPAVIERRTQLWYITRETASLWYYWIFDDSSDIRVEAA